MTPSKWTKICSPKGEGRLSAFTFLGTISRPEDGPFFGGALVEASCKHVHVHVTIMHVACVTSLCLCTTFCPPFFVLVKAGIGCEVSLRHVPKGLRFVASMGGTAHAICCEPSAAGTCSARICGPVQFVLLSCSWQALLLLLSIVCRDVVFPCSRSRCWPAASLCTSTLLQHVFGGTASAEEVATCAAEIQELCCFLGLEAQPTCLQVPYERVPFGMCLTRRKSVACVSVSCWHDALVHDEPRQCLSCMSSSQKS